MLTVPQLGASAVGVLPSVQSFKGEQSAPLERRIGYMYPSDSHVNGPSVRVRRGRATSDAKSSVPLLCLQLRCLDHLLNRIIFPKRALNLTRAIHVDETDQHRQDLLRQRRHGSLSTPRSTGWPAARTMRKPTSVTIPQVGWKHDQDRRAHVRGEIAHLAEHSNLVKRMANISHSSRLGGAQKRLKSVPGGAGELLFAVCVGGRLNSATRRRGAP